MFLYKYILNKFDFATSDIVLDICLFGFNVVLNI